MFTICTSPMIYRHTLLSPKVCFSLALCTIEVTNFVTLLWPRHFAVGKSRSPTKLRLLWRFLSTCFIIKRTKIQVVFYKLYPKSYYNINLIALACFIFFEHANDVIRSCMSSPFSFWHPRPILSIRFYRKKQNFYWTSLFYLANREIFGRSDK